MSNDMTRRNFLLAGGAVTGTLALGATGLVRPAHAASNKGSSGWKPAREIRIIVPFAPGGGSDVFARARANVLRTQKPLDVVVENHAGGNGAIGYAFYWPKKASPIICWHRRAPPVSFCRWSSMCPIHGTTSRRLRKRWKTPPC